MRPSRGACLALLVVLPSCASSQRGSGGVAERPPAAELERRAERLWAARAEEDWATVLQFEHPRRREQIVEAEYAAWKKENEPFKIHEFQLGRVQTEQNLGWVEVDYRTSVRQYPNVPPRNVKQWEKWHITGGQWYPLSQRQLELYPEAPARRDAAEEARLRKRFAATRRARRQRDWQQLYELIDPRDRKRVTKEQLGQEENLFEHLSCELQWVEAIGDRGRVRVLHEVKLNDPSLTKLPPTATPVTEQWVKYENDWYLDLAPTRR